MVLYRSISEFMYTDMLRQILRLQSWYFEDPSYMVLTIDKPELISLITVYFPWVNSYEFMMSGFGYALFDLYYYLAGYSDKMDMAIGGVLSDIIKLSRWFNRMPIRGV